MQPISTDRREFIKAAGLLAVATAASTGISVNGASSQQALFDGDGAAEA